MIELEPLIEWLPRLNPQLIGSAPSDHYFDGRVARPLNSLPHEPFANTYRTVRARHTDRPQNICHCVDANASFEDGRFWTSDVPSQHFMSVCPYLHPGSASMYPRPVPWPPFLSPLKPSASQDWITEGLLKQKVASPHFNSHHKYHIEVGMPCIAASAHTILL